MKFEDKIEFHSPNSFSLHWNVSKSLTKDLVKNHVSAGKTFEVNPLMSGGNKKVTHT